MRLVLYIFLAFSCINSKAQNKLLLCSNYTNDGAFAGDYENWTIQKGGNYMFLHYTSSTPINDTIFIGIEKNFNRRDTNYYEYDHYYLITDSSRKWAVNKYVFTKTGQYKMTAYDRHNNQLAPIYTTFIRLEDKAYSDMYFTDTWYYEKSKIFFYEKTIGDTMFGKNNVFTYQPTGSKVILYIEQPEGQSLKTNHLLISVFSDDKCHEHLFSYTYYLEKSWFWTHVPIYFYQKGKYIVELYNDDDVFINSASLEIK